MSANQPTAAKKTGPSPPRANRRWVFPVWRWVLAALALGVALGAGVALLHSARTAPGVSTLPDRPAATWPAETQRAPGFRLANERGGPISLREFRGRPVIVTFIDPACTTLCPLEAQALNLAVASIPAAERPVIVAVSVNPWADSRANFRHDTRKWHLVRQWRWAVGRYAQLAAVWKRYRIGVLVKTTVVGGIAVHDVSHTEASFVIDRSGYERALFLFPFGSQDVANALAHLAVARS
jgi:cytochrome oxidase Cu insertion factor (SCO1/SenC/PrrC family)